MFKIETNNAYGKFAGSKRVMRMRDASHAAKKHYQQEIRRAKTRDEVNDILARIARDDNLLYGDFTAVNSEGYSKRSQLP